MLGLERIMRLPGDDVFVHRLQQPFLETLLVKLVSRFSRQDRQGPGSEACDQHLVVRILVHNRRDDVSNRQRGPRELTIGCCEPRHSSGRSGGRRQ